MAKLQIDLNFIISDIVAVVPLPELDEPSEKYVKGGDVLYVTGWGHLEDGRCKFMITSH